MSYTPTDEERAASLYCIRNCIRISPKGVYKKKEWHIDVSLDGQTWHTSPDTYTEDELWKKYYDVCNYYYQKRT